MSSHRISLIQRGGGNMDSFTSLTPLGHTEPRTEAIGPFQLSELPHCARAGLAVLGGDETGLNAALRPWLGADLPGPGRMAGADGRRAIWQGPGQWLIEAHGVGGLAGELSELCGAKAAVTEQSAAYAAFGMEGPELHRALALLCPLDAPQHQGGEAERTLIHHLSCLVLCVSPERYEIMGLRSAAASLHHALATALRAVG